MMGTPATDLPTMSKPWATQTIAECGEPLEILPSTRFAFVTPHPYQSLGAPYGDVSPYQLRRAVLRRLLTVQAILDERRPSCRLMIFDAYRPNEVQQFMVDYSYRALLQERGLQHGNLDQATRQALWEEVFRYWSIPSDDPRTPPAHSTGAAVDLGILDASGKELPMGTAIDEFSPRSAPLAFADSSDPQARAWHANRQLLCELMQAQGFVQHSHEWWHFSYGDQMWAARQTGRELPAIYGRADLV